MGILDTLPDGLAQDVILAVLPHEGSLRDRSSGGATITPSGGLVWRGGDRDRITGNGSSGTIDCGVFSSADFSAGITVFSGFSLDRLTGSADIQVIFGGSSALYLDISNDRLRSFASGLNAISLGGITTLQESRHYSAAYVYDGSTTQYLYLDGSEDNSGATSGTMTLGSVQLMRATAGVGRYLGGSILTLLLFDRGLLATEIAALHAWEQRLSTARRQWQGGGLDYSGAEFTGEPRYLDNIQTARVSLADETSGLLSNTPYRIVSGAWRVVEDTTTGRRAIECMTAGRLARRNLHPYGTHHLKVEHVGATRNTMISSNTETLGGGSKNGYDVTLTSGDDLRLIRYLSGATANLFLDDAGAYPDGEYDIRLTRALDGTITVYVNNVLVDPLSGSNPVVDTNVTASLYMLFDYDPGDRLYLDRQYAGVVP